MLSVSNIVLCLKGFVMAIGLVQMDAKRYDTGTYRWKSRSITNSTCCQVFTTFFYCTFFIFYDFFSIFLFFYFYFLYFSLIRVLDNQGIEIFEMNYVYRCCHMDLHLM